MSWTQLDSDSITHYWKPSTWRNRLTSPLTQSRQYPHLLPAPNIVTQAGHRAAKTCTYMLERRERFSTGTRSVIIDSINTKLVTSLAPLSSRPATGAKALPAMQIMALTRWMKNAKNANAASPSPAPSSNTLNMPDAELISALLVRVQKRTIAGRCLCTSLIG